MWAIGPSDKSYLSPLSSLNHGPGGHLVGGSHLRPANKNLTGLLPHRGFQDVFGMVLSPTHPCAIQREVVGGGRLFEKKNGNRVWLNQFAWQSDKALIPRSRERTRGAQCLASDRKVERCQRRTFTTISYLFCPSPLVIHPLGGYLIVCFCLEERLSFTPGRHHLQLPAAASRNRRRRWAEVAAHHGG